MKKSLFVDQLVKRFKLKDSAQLMYLLSVIIVGVALLLGAWFFFLSSDGPSPSSIVRFESEQRDNADDCDYHRLVDGMCVEEENDMNPPLVAIMVENHIHAQPLSGIADAAVVYEAPVEGSIPRLMAIYPLDSDVEKVGPVRSARPYYLDWVHEYGQMMYMHVGGSPEALERISAEGIFDMNEFSRGWYFWRSKDRGAPHNVYTAENLWNAAFERYGDADADTTFASWKFQKADRCQENCITDISLSYGGGAYTPEWTFNSSTMQYDRSEFRRTDRDQDGTAIVVDTVIVQYVDATVLDNIGRLGIDTIGSGDAVVFQGGHAIEGQWQKENRHDRTRWFDEDNEEIELNPGKIWVQVVSQFNNIEY